MLAKSRIGCPIIYGGNSRIAPEVREILMRLGKECFPVHNIIPGIGQLDTETAEQVIRELFMQRIVNMKGLGEVQSIIGNILMPTPAAVLAAGEILARGCNGLDGIDDLMIVDIGGATTDIHSYTEPAAFEGARQISAAEPYAKRTVEGDLGMRESADTLFREAGHQKIAAAAGLSPDKLETSIAHRVKDISFLPASAVEKEIDQQLAASAAGIAARRHVGRVERIHASNCNWLQTGKNLSKVRSVLGTGGPIINSPDPAGILRETLLGSHEKQDILLPREAAFYVDGEYILYAAGLLGVRDRELAFHLLKNSVSRIC
jgi:uncharacterized protein (TIGR01319 family)